MKLQQLAEVTATPVSTVKFYLREGLLPAGRKLNATTAAYGPAHVERLELIRALRQVVGLGLVHVRQVVEAVETLDPVRMMGRVQTIVLDLPPAAPDDGGTGSQVRAEQPARPPGDGRGRLTARDILAAMGWQEGSPESIAALDGQLASMDAWGLSPTLDTALVYARAVDRVAEHELTVDGPWAPRGGSPAGGAGSASGAGAREGEGGSAGAEPASGPPSPDRIAAYTAVGVHAYSQLLLRLHSVAQGSHARSLGLEGNRRSGEGRDGA